MFFNETRKDKKKTNWLQNWKVIMLQTMQIRHLLKLKITLKISHDLLSKSSNNQIKNLIMSELLIGYLNDWLW